ncbi:MAG: hypothetical protein KDK25_05995 [Leptospiraceae bacterium]|nr:hypothetical protein [Leptospiraceae bacterium]
MATLAFAMSFATPVLHRCPQIGSPGLSQTDSSAPSHCHRMPARGVFAPDSPEGRRGEENVAAKQSESSHGDGHDHGSCVVCQGYMCLQTLGFQGAVIFFVSCIDVGIPLPSPPASRSGQSPAPRARGPPVILFAD